MAFFSVTFAAVGTYFINNHSTSIAYFFLALAIIFLFITLIKPEILYPFNKLWMGFGFLLGMIVSRIVLGVIFFGLFTPMGLLMKAFGRDELRLTIRDRISHWKVRSLDNEQADTFNSILARFSFIKYATLFVGTLTYVYYFVPLSKHSHF